MTRILVATWTEHDNYGSILQAYCLKEALADLFANSDGAKYKNIEVRILNNLAEADERSKNNNSLYQKIRTNLNRRGFEKFYGKIIKAIFRKKINQRIDKFSEFRTKELNLYPENPITRYELLYDLPKFDLYIAGSDQIWNPKLLNKVYLLPWTPKKVEKIAYAPSVCVSHLSEDELKIYRELSTFKALSVREYTEAVKQISELIHKKIFEVVDPVVLYGRKKLLKKCRAINAGNYAAIYLLNGTKKRHNIYAEFLKKSHLQRKIIPTTNYKNLFFEALSGSIDWGIGPFEFINLIFNSRVLITDSFHGVIVALLLHKDLIVLSRKEEESEQDNRLKNLLEKVGLEERFGKMPKCLDEIDTINWNKIDTKINNMRRKSQEFLIKNI